MTHGLAEQWRNQQRKAAVFVAVDVGYDCVIGCVTLACMQPMMPLPLALQDCQVQVA